MKRSHFCMANLAEVELQFGRTRFNSYLGLVGIELRQNELSLLSVFEQFGKELKTLLTRHRDIVD